MQQGLAAARRAQINSAYAQLFPRCLLTLCIRAQNRAPSSWRGDALALGIDYGVLVGADFTLVRLSRCLRNARAEADLPLVPAGPH
eukprot:141611-Pleurochrysis_carterae.AAC.2